MKGGPSPTFRPFVSWSPNGCATGGNLSLHSWVPLPPRTLCPFKQYHVHVHSLHQCLLGTSCELGSAGRG